MRNFSQEAKTIIEKLLKEKHFDVIHAETFYIMPHIPKTNIPTLLVEQTVEYKVYQHFISTLPFYLRLPFSVDILKLKMWETFYWQKADLVATVSDSDQHEIQKLTKNLKSVVIPNGAGDEMFVDRFQKLDKKNPTSKSWPCLQKNKKKFSFRMTLTSHLIKTRKSLTKRFRITNNIFSG